MNEVYIKKLSFLQGVLRDRSGFTLPEVMIAALILGGVAVAMFQLTKDQMSSKVKSEVTTGVAQFRTLAQSIYLSPASCNANFRGKAASGANITVAAADGVRKCNLGQNCLTVGVGYTVLYPVHTTGWEPQNTKLSNRVRIKSIVYNIKPGHASYPSISEAKVSIVLETLPDLTKKNVATGNQVTKVVEETVEIGVPVVVLGSTIQGCPKAWNSTFVYDGT